MESTILLIHEGLVYLVDLTDFTSRLSCCDEEQLRAYARALRDGFFVPIARETVRICEQAPAGASQWHPAPRPALINTPGDAAILVFHTLGGELPLDYLVDELCAMTRALTIDVPGTPGEKFQLKFGMDLGSLVKCGKPLSGYPGVSSESSDMSFAPDFFLGDVINRLARIVSSPVDAPHAPRVSRQLWDRMSDRFRRSREGRSLPIRDYPAKGSCAEIFHLLQDAQA